MKFNQDVMNLCSYFEFCSGEVVGGGGQLEKKVQELELRVLGCFGHWWQCWRLRGRRRGGWGEGRGEGGLSHGPAGKLGDRRGGEMR